MAALDLLSGWPVDHAAAAIVRPGSTTTAGDATRGFAWASVTKLVTALATLVAVEEGTVALDEPAGPPGSTVRHLLAHASGLADTDGLLVPPATRRIYTNRGFEVLAEHVGRAAGIPFAAYAREAVVDPLAMPTVDVSGSPAAGATGSLSDLVALAHELLAPTLVSAATMREATSVQFPRLDGVLPGFGRQRPNDWGLGVELRDAKSPHWTGSRNSHATFGHFGRSGTFLWVDPDAGLALACLTDREFGPWAATAWPALGDAVLSDAS